MEHLNNLLNEKKIYVDRNSQYSNIQKIFDSLESKYRLVYDNDQILPFLYCQACTKFFVFFKVDPHKKIRNNSKSNFVNHRCVLLNDAVKITNYRKPANMKLPMRQSINAIIADQIARHPTMSIQSSVDFFNKVSTDLQTLILNNGHPVTFDIDRKTVGKKIIAIGQNVKQQNLDFFTANIKSSSLTFDHWTKNGSNFFGAIGRTAYEDFSFKSYIAGFFKADLDKSAKGYLADLNKLVPGECSELPLMSDNCNTMKRLSKISSKYRKIFCASHKLAIIDEKLHRESVISKIDAELVKINSYFNYRHNSFDLPLKPQTSTSATRAWRSHKENYETSLRNFEHYENLSVEKHDFPPLPDKMILKKISNFETTLCSYFDILEAKDSDLLDQMKVFVKLVKLSKEKVCTDIVGNSLGYIVNNPSTINTFLSDDTLAYAYLSKINFDYTFANMPNIDTKALVKQAKTRIRMIAMKCFMAESKVQQAMSINDKEDPDLFEPVSDTVIEEDLFEKFDQPSGLRTIAFWAEKKAEFKLLFKIYLQLRSIPASNSSIERAFSVAGRIFDELKASTSDDSIEAQIALCLEKELQ